MSSSIQQTVRCEIEDFHESLQAWFTGSAKISDFESKFLVRFSPKLIFIPPAGQLLGLDDLSSAVRAGYASNREFRIQIRRVEVQKEFDGYVLATYEEWQRNALASKPANNGRVATVLFSSGDLKWHHIHETWLPGDIIAAGPYDF